MIRMAQGAIKKTKKAIQPFFRQQARNKVKVALKMLKNSLDPVISGEQFPRQKI
jgi:hypothetical protein